MKRYQLFTHLSASSRRCPFYFFLNRTIPDDIELVFDSMLKAGIYTSGTKRMMQEKENGENAGSLSSASGRSPLVSAHPPSPLRAVSVNAAAKVGSKRPAAAKRALGSSRLRPTSRNASGMKRSKSSSTTESKPIAPISIDSDEMLEKRFASIAKTLRGDDWAKRVEAIQRIHEWCSEALLRAILMYF